MKTTFSKMFFSNYLKRYRLQNENGNHKLIEIESISKTQKSYNNKPVDLILKQKYDHVIIGAGHNGLVCANYLAKAKKKVLILEKRHLVGGCAVTEELVEGYKLSRCSYVLSLFRKVIIEELFKNDFYDKIKLLKRDPKGITPTVNEGVYLLMKSDIEFTKNEIKKFSQNDALNYEKFNKFLGEIVNFIEPLIDMQPPTKLTDPNIFKLARIIFKNRKMLIKFYHFLTSDSKQILDTYFESDILKGTFATDAVIGAMKSPLTPGSAYVLLHHIFGTLDKEGSWFYIQGGMGSLSNYLADKAVANGVDILLNTEVEEILTEDKNKITGVKIGGQILKTESLIANCDVNVVYNKLLKNNVTKLVRDEFKTVNFNSPVVKINLIVDKIPGFKCLSPLVNGDFNSEKYQKQIAKEYLTGTIHLNCESIDKINDNYLQALVGKISSDPLIEITIPSILDSTIVPSGSNHHIIGLFCQYFPKDLMQGEWDQSFKEKIASKIFDEIDKYAPNFTKSIIFKDILTPFDLEEQFSITGGNIYHGSTDLNSIFFCRPTLGNSNYEQKVNGLYLCSSSMHPGGGVMGAAGRNCAKIILSKI